MLSHRCAAAGSCEKLLCSMKPCSKSPPMLLKLIYITLLPVLEAHRVNVQPEVTGYLGQDVTLPCQFIQESGNASITQVQWDLLQPEGEPITIVVSSSQFGVNIPDSPLKGGLDITEQSLTIKDVEMRDAGLYRCTIATFPLGSFVGTTKLVVREQMPLSPGMVSAIVIVVILLVGIMATVAYWFFIRRRDSSVRHQVFIDTGGTATDAARPSFIVKDQDVVYSDVKFKPFSEGTPSSNNQHTETMYADVTYAKVVLGQKPKL
ncbi:nectin-2-like isoform X2 [Trachinotus anak]|uniref:nectin-2-like isoform X2 n=1 Tax=Trachinotus anak TaxID=443729 RepID=UPI0039F1B47C